jgi:hypothetical protein
MSHILLQFICKFGSIETEQTEPNSDGYILYGEINPHRFKSQILSVVGDVFINIKTLFD